MLANHIELAGIEAAGVTAGSELETVQDLWIDEIADAVHRRIPRAAGITAMATSGDLDHVKVDIHARRPGLVHGQCHAEIDRLRAELQELTGRPAWIRCPPTVIASRTEVRRVTVIGSGSRGGWAVPARAPRRRDRAPCGTGQAIVRARTPPDRGVSHSRPAAGSPATRPAAARR